MQILKNKHLIMAMFVAPALAIIAYFSVDYMVTEKPKAALPGSSYKLAAKSNCRYKSGACTLKNGDIEVQIRARRVGEKEVVLTLFSELPIKNVIISYVAGDITTQPEQMNASTADTEDWHAIVKLDEPENSTLRLAMNIAGSMYYAETTAVFVDFETSFSRENFSE